MNFENLYPICYSFLTCAKDIVDLKAYYLFLRFQLMICHQVYSLSKVDYDCIIYRLNAILQIKELEFTILDKAP